MKKYMKTLVLVVLCLSATLFLSSYAKSNTAEYMAGNTVSFGNYEQDNNKGNGPEVIQWRVLKREGSRALLVSVYNLDNQPYNTEYAFVTWETSTLRTWLNGTFLNAAFTQEQQRVIVTSTLKNDKNSRYDTSGGNVTQDKVFLLSESEAELYFTGDADRIAKNTAYAKVEGAYTNDSGAGVGWLRLPGYNQSYAAIVSDRGSVYRYGYGVSDSSVAVRPALWLDLSSF